MPHTSIHKSIQLETVEFGSTFTNTWEAESTAISTVDETGTEAQTEQIARPTTFITSSLGVVWSTDEVTSKEPVSSTADIYPGLPDISDIVFSSVDLLLPSDLTVPGIPSETSDGLPPKHDDEVSQFPDGATAAIVIGLVVLLASLGYAIFYFQRKKRFRKQTTPDFSSLASSYEHALHLNDLQPKGPPASPPVGLDTWLSYHAAGQPRASVWPRMQFSSPQPAVAEVQSFTRARQKPRVCEIGGGSIGPVVEPDAVYQDERTQGEFSPARPRQQGHDDQRQTGSDWDSRWDYDQLS